MTTRKYLPILLASLFAPLHTASGATPYLQGTSGIAFESDSKVQNSYVDEIT